MQFLIDNKAAVLGALLALSEVMALIPGLKSSGIIDLLIRLLKSALGQ